MSELAKSDAFFFITTICVVIVTLIVVVGGAYAIRVFADVKYITKRAKKETDEIADDLKAAREHLKEKGSGFLSVLSSIASFGKAKKRKKEEN